MPRPGKSLVSRFLDISADVDSEEELEDEDKDEYEDEDKVIESAKQIQQADVHPTVQEQDNRSEASMLFLEQLEHRYSGQTTDPPMRSANDEADDPEYETFQQKKIRLPGPTDGFNIWRLKFTPGHDYDVLVYLMSLKTTELHSAFTNPYHEGLVYLEARFRKPSILPMNLSLQDLLHVRSDVRMSTLAVVPQTEAWQCLRIRNNVDDEQVFSLGRWVEICSGRYKGDVGVTLGTSFESMHSPGAVEVLVILRIPLWLHLHSSGSRKWPRNTRPPSALFSIHDCSPEDQHLFTEPSDCEVSGKYYVHSKLGRFEYGLLVKRLNPLKLKLTGHVKPELRTLFFESEHLVVRQRPMPLPEFWKFETGNVVSIEDSEAIGTVETVLPSTCEVHTENTGLLSVPTWKLHKRIVPGDYIKVLAGEYVDQTGLVGGKIGRSIGIIPNGTHEIAFSVDVNLVSRTTQGSPIGYDFPWYNVQSPNAVSFWIQNWEGCVGEVKNVWPDRKGSLQLLLYFGVLDCSLEVDYTQVVEKNTRKLLHEFQPLLPRHKHFEVSTELLRLKIDKKPWMGAQVSVVKGHWKGYRGVVHDVMLRNVDHVKTPTASGVAVRVELNVSMTNRTMPREDIDYNFLHETSTGKLLADTIPPNNDQSIFLPHSAYRPSSHGLPFRVSNSGISTTDNNSTRSVTPPITDFERDYIFTGEWSVYHGVGVLDPKFPSLSTFQPPPNYFNNAHEQWRDETETEPIPAARQNHWLFHTKLQGISIRVDIQGTKYDTLSKQKSTRDGRYVKVVPRMGGGFMLNLVGSKASEAVGIDVQYVLRHRDPPKPNTEKRLMVVIGGDEEHIGKFVRQIYHFYQGVKQPENMWFILGVVEFSTGQEVLSAERLELPPDQVEIVLETEELRKKSRTLLGPAQDAACLSLPKIRGV
ncbi:hypothetical protein F5050DRAFT_1812734 [Lentinula boryana]|uniref:Chromatin elongation factor spt5 n=1 Tax=Lentinula boryana TaxID=40481 RepID=A0ABQ8PXX0_9AGAR|nr:hypothetical protein F5050DRAFT_1812734 [Lentinula boryana]